MYIDKNMQLEFYIPKDLQEYLDMAEKCFAEDDDNHFDDAMEMVEVLAKAYAMDGTISYPDMHKIKVKYGGWG